MSAVIAEAKNNIRKKILSLLRKQKEEDRTRNSLVIRERLFALPEFLKAKTILFYASYDGEVDTLEMMKRSLRQGKRVALPTITQKDKKITPMLINNLEEDLTVGPYGIKQPDFTAARQLDVAELDLLVVPGVAFDRGGHRLGRGAGYYDRFLAGLPKGTPTVGLAFDFQIVERLPRQDHDFPVSRIITN